jgi:hypothetical protein
MSSTATMDESDLGSQADRFVEALEPRVMGPRIAAAVGGATPTCHVLDAKLEPGLRAIILYEYDGRLYRGDVLPHLEDRALQFPGAARLLAPGVRLCGFPRDPELPLLPQVMDPARLGRAIKNALRSTPAVLMPRATTRCRTTLLRYRPGKRATVLTRFGTGTDRFVAKAYHDPAKAAAVAGEAPLLAACTSARGTLRFAVTLAHLTELDTVVQRAVDGTPLDALVSGGPVAAMDAVGRAALALAELHEAQVLPGRRRLVERELVRFGERARRVGTVDPQLGDAAGQLAERLRGLHQELPMARTGPVHGDCKPSQFLLAEHGVYLMDLDHLGLSDQATDVGTFLASLRQLAVRQSHAVRPRSDARVLADLSDRFLQSYQDTRGDRSDTVRIRWQEAVALERKALRAFARAPRSPMAGSLIAEANRCLDHLGETA